MNSRGVMSRANFRFCALPVAELFDRYIASSDMPGRWGKAAAQAPDDAARARIVADFIAGMTDPYAEAEHARLFDGKVPVE